MAPSQLPLPSFTLVLTCDSPDGLGPPIEVLVMKDWRQASRREVHLNLQPKDSDPLMKTVDTRLANSFAYDVVYSDGKGRNTHQQSNASASPSSSSTSSTSTSDVELYTIFEEDESEFGVFELGQAYPPLHLQPPSLAPLGPRYDSQEAIPLRVAGQANSTGGRTSAAPSSNRRRYSTSARRIASVKVLFNFLKLFRSLWRKLEKAGAVVGRMCRRGPNLLAN